MEAVFFRLSRNNSFADSVKKRKTCLSGIGGEGGGKGEGGRGGKETINFFYPFSAKVQGIDVKNM